MFSTPAHASSHVRESTIVLDSGFQTWLWTLHFGFQLLVGLRIPLAKFSRKKLLDFTSKTFPDSRNQIPLHTGDMMHDAVDDCSVVLQQGTTSTLSRNSRGETKRGKMDQPQTRFEESAVLAVIGSVRHQDPLGYANNHS